MEFQGLNIYRNRYQIIMMDSLVERKDKEIDEQLIVGYIDSNFTKSKKTRKLLEVIDVYYDSS